MQICQCVGRTDGIQPELRTLRKGLHILSAGFWTSPSLFAKINLSEAAPLLPDISTLLGG